MINNHSIINNNFDNLITGIKQKNNGNKIKVILLLIYKSIKNNINEKYLFNFIKVLLKKNPDINIYLIKDIKRSIQLLKESNYNLLHYFLINYYKKDKCIYKFNKLIEIYKKTNGSIKKYFKNIKSIKDIKNIFKNHVYLIIKSFNDKKFLNSLKNPCFSLNWISKNINKWKNINSIEIEIRLKNLVNIFGLTLLTHLKIKIISVEEFNILDFKEKVKYYEVSIKKIFLHYNEFENNLFTYNEILKDINDFEQIKINKKDKIDNIINDFISFKEKKNDIEYEIVGLMNDLIIKLENNN